MNLRDALRDLTTADILDSFRSYISTGDKEMKQPKRPVTRVDAKMKRLAARMEATVEQPATEPPPTKEEVDEAFEAITGHKRPAPGSPEPDEQPDSETGTNQPQKVVDTAPPVGVDLLQSSIQATFSVEPKMTLTFKSLSKNGKNAFYTGGAAVLRFALSAFPNKQHPTSFEVADGVFAAPKADKVPLTAEEKAAAALVRKNAPKPTLVERIAKREEALARDKAKLAAAN